MAQDYHIYLHSSSSSSSGGNGGGSQTKPFSQRTTDNDGVSFSTLAKPYSMAKTMVSGGALSTGVSALAKVLPWVAIVKAVIDVTDKVVSTGFSHLEEYTGNYKYNLQFNNFKTGIKAFLNPTGYIFSVAHDRFQMDKQNKGIAQQNRLIGNSILKDFNIGV